MYNMVAYRDDPSGYLQNEPAYRDASPEQGYNFLDYLDPLRRRQSEVVQLADNSPSATPGAGAPTAGLPTASVPNAGPSAPADPIASGESDGEYFMPGGELNWPTNYPLVTGEFGVVDTDHWPNGHTGIDARAPLGSPIYAMDGGEVISTTPSPGGANQIIVQHPDGKIGGYAHLDPTVGIGDQLLPGQVIGHSDGSGNVKPHAHISLRPGKDKARIDPYLFLPQVPIKKRH
jgi:murein DD-endopeptidase MepM/ murein hydrolase activator NlpD